MTCRPFPTDRDIVVVRGQHVDPCAATWMPELNGNCPGCVLCHVEANRHCGTCYSHLDTGVLGTCTDCRGIARRALRDVFDLAALLPDQALNGARDGHLDAAATIPGADALVLLARGSEGLDDDDLNELLPPSFVFAWWEETWAEARGNPSHRPAWQDRPAATLVRAYGYLTGDAFDWAAANHPGFKAFTRDIKRTRAQLEDVLHAGLQPAEGVPCFVCGADLTRTYRDPRDCGCGPRPTPEHRHAGVPVTYAKGRRTPAGDVCCLGCAQIIRWELAHAHHDQGGDTTTDPLDGWSCPRCQRTYSPGEYQLAVSVLATQHATALPATELAERLGVNASTIWRWARDGHVHKRGRGPDNRQLYDVVDAHRHAASKVATGAEVKGVQS